MKSFEWLLPTGATLVMGRLPARESRVCAPASARRCASALRQLGYASREGPAEGAGRFWTPVFAVGAAPLERLVVATWPVQHSAAEVLASWREKIWFWLASMWPTEVKETVLSQLAVWAKDAFRLAGSSSIG